MTMEYGCVDREELRGSTKFVSQSRVGRPIVLILLGAYWPGNEATGPNQSVVALCRSLAGEFEFRILARDRPLGSPASMAPNGRWIELGDMSARYCSVGSFGAAGLADILCSTPHHALMMNGFFDREFTIPATLLRALGRVPRRPTIISTRGEFASGALSLKSGRKRAFLEVAGRLGLHKDIWLEAAGPREAADIESVYPRSRGILVAPNIRHLVPDLPLREIDPPLLPLRVVFLGRVSRVKNLDLALRILAKVECPLVFDIFGPLEDARYWDECRRLVDRLPAHVRGTYKGEIPNAAVVTTLADYDLFFLPTRGENFGHAIMEALSAGVPALISDQTPLVDLQARGAGWSLPLDDLGSFATKIDEMARMSREGRRRLGSRARRCAAELIEKHDAINANRKILMTILAGGPA
jgi:glycosyltransferase involved in cell wall biosynthesis